MDDKVKTLGIVFDNEQRNGYCAGEVVSGYVLIEASALVNVKAIKLSTKGCAQVCWHDPRRESSPTYAPSLSHCVKEEIEYLSISQTLLETTDGKNISLNAGHHEIPFELELPQRTLVSSFTGKYGSVCYMVKAVLQRPFHRDQSVFRQFPVISHIDVNSPMLLSPVSNNNEKMVGCWIFTSGPISLSVNIERKGYCNGESIAIYAEIENCSSRLIVPKAVIYQIQTYTAKGKTKTHQQVVASVRGNHIPSGSSESWNGKTLKIPPVSPSILNSSVLRVEYSLAVVVQIPGAKKLTVELPIMIGTIPYNGLGSRDVSWLTLALPDAPEAPPNYADIVPEEEFELHSPSSHQSDELERQLGGPVFAYIQEFRFQPPPLYSEVDPHPEQE